MPSEPEHGPVYSADDKQKQEVRSEIMRSIRYLEEELAQTPISQIAGTGTNTPGNDTWEQDTLLQLPAPGMGPYGTPTDAEKRKRRLEYARKHHIASVRGKNGIINADEVIPSATATAEILGEIHRMAKMAESKQESQRQSKPDDDDEDDVSDAEERPSTPTRPDAAIHSISSPSSNDQLGRKRREGSESEAENAFIRSISAAGISATASSLPAKSRGKHVPPRPPSLRLHKLAGEGDTGAVDADSEDDDEVQNIVQLIETLGH